MAKRSAKSTAWRGFVVLLVTAFLASGALRFLGEGRAFATDGQVDPSLLLPESPVSMNEVNTLISSLKARETLLEERSRELDLVEADIDLARQEIRARLDELVLAEERLSKRMALSNEASTTDLDQLTRVYEAMKPKVAAELFATMDPEFAAEFLVRMNPDQAAAVFSNLPPTAAYALSATMAGRNALAATEASE